MLIKVSYVIKVILVDEHAVVRSGVRRLLEDHDAITVIAETDNGDEAYQLYNTLLPDVLVMDMMMSDSSGLAALGQIVARHPDAKVLMFSMHKQVSYAAQAISAGAKGYMLKSSTAEELLQAVLKVAAGASFLSAEIAQKIALHNLSDEQDPMQLLTAREFEIFRLLAEGEDVNQIASLLKIGQKTVANYQTQLKNKLDIQTPIQLVRLALKHQVIQL